MQLIPKKYTTTKDDKYQRLVESFDRLGVEWKQAVWPTKDNHKLSAGKLGSQQGLKKNFFNYHFIVHHEFLCRRFMEVRTIMNAALKRLILSVSKVLTIGSPMSELRFCAKPFVLIVFSVSNICGSEMILSIRVE
ncbi:hypothetical protein RF11_05537 [Thelohanellus kitauei]|uniref:Uncharacterized protein n=1 Tax=Thelohanellus kitauei TaxID=669202 RepID=A0A0C2N2P3_THEKT|nr:hypothetical protein RF11_05537 [Thelohanellus kitauei]